MTVQWQMHRAGLFWLLVTLCAIVSGLSGVLPVWVIIFCFYALLWRVQIFRGAWNPPSKTIKVLLVLTAMAGLIVEYQRLNSIESLSAMLMSGFALKLLEINYRRDATVIVYVGFFCTALLLLFAQDIITGLYSLFCLICALASLLGLHQTASLGLWVPFKKSATLFLQSLPVMLVLFLVMPRLGAFWSMPTQQHQGVTGVSGEMSPGDLTRLGKSAKLAFRATFNGEIPDVKELYWRGVILSSFDGRTWQQGDPQSYGDGGHIYWSRSSEPLWSKNIARGKQRYQYNIIMEPTYQPWLFALAAPDSVSPSVGLTREMRLVNNQPVNHKVSYNVTSWPDYHYFPDQLHQQDRFQHTQLPENFNPKSIQRAKQWFQKSDNVEDYIDHLLLWFNQEFTYTLTPDKLGKHSVDEFLFTTKRGFCSFFASSFTFMMRAAGIPARVVVGYQGAEVHSSGNYLLVHQYNAHAWSEVWIAGQGWVRIDPTAAVASERIELGFEEYFADDEQFLTDSPLSLIRFRGIGWINDMRMNFDLLNYHWVRWVLNYDDRQQNVLKKLLGDINGFRIAIFIFSIAGVVLALIAFLLLRGAYSKPELDSADKLFNEFCDKLASVGVTRLCGEGAKDFAARAAKELPGSAVKIEQISRHYQYIRYAGQHHTEIALKQMVKKFSVK